MTRRPFLSRKERISSASVVVGKPSSATLSTKESFSKTVLSEQTVKNENGKTPSAQTELAAHDLSVCLSNRSEGKRTNVRSAPNASFTRTPTSVFPVPQEDASRSPRKRGI